MKTLQRSLLTTLLQEPSLMTIRELNIGFHKQFVNIKDFTNSKYFSFRQI
jgi:hypothetical protein